MRVLKDSLKRSLVFLLVFTLAISGVDLTVFANNTKQPKIASKIKVAMTFYDWSKEDANCDVSSLQYKGSRGYGTDFIYKITVPMDFGDLTDFSDYTKDRVTSIELRLESDDIEVQYTPQTDSDFNSYLPLGYYQIKGIDSTCVSLFDKYLEKNSIDINVKDDVEQAAKDFADSDVSLIINYDNDVSLETEVFFYFYDYIPSESYYINGIESIVKEISNGVDYINSYNDGTDRVSILSVPTSKTVKNSDFINNNNAIFYTKSGKYLDTYYVDIDSENSIKLPLDDLSYSADVTNVKFGDVCALDTPYSVDIKSINYHDTDINDLHYFTTSNRWWLTGGLYPYTLSSILRNKGIYKLKYNDKVYDINDLNFRYSNDAIYELSDDGVGIGNKIANTKDFINNLQIPYVYRNVTLSGNESKDDWLFTKNKYKHSDLIKDKELKSDLRARIIFKKSYSKDDFDGLDYTFYKGYGYGSGCALGYEDSCTPKYTDALPHSCGGLYYGGVRYDKIPERDYFYCNTNSYWTSQVESLLDNSLYYYDRPLVSFYAYSNYTLPDKYSDIYTKYDSSLEPDFDKIDDSMIVKDTKQRVIRIPADSKETENFLDKVFQKGSEYFVCVDTAEPIRNRAKVIYNNYEDYWLGVPFDYNNGSNSRYVTEGIRNIDGYYYINFDYDYPRGSKYCVPDSVILNLLNKYYDCGFETIDDLFRSDFFGGYSYEFIVPEGTEGLDNFTQNSKSCYSCSNLYDKYTRTGQYGYTYFFSDFTKNDDNSVTIHVPVWNIYRFMCNEGERFLSDYLKNFCKKTSYYTVTDEDSTISSDKLITFNIIGKDNISTLNKCVLANSNKGGLTKGVHVNVNGTSYPATLSSVISSISSSNSIKAIYLRICEDYYSYSDSISSDKKTYDFNGLIEYLEDNGFEIDYDESYIPDIENLKWETLSDPGVLKIYDYPEVTVNDKLVVGNQTNAYSDIYTKKHIKTNSSVDRNNAIINDFRGFDKGVKSPIYMQVRDSDTSQRDEYSLYVKNALSSTGIIVRDTDLSRGTSYLSATWGSTSYEFPKNDIIGTYVNYKYGDIIFASRPSVVQDLAIDGKGNVIWDKSADEGLGVDADGKSKSDDIVKLESYTLYVSDKDGNKLYTDTVTPSEAHDSALKTPVVSPSSIVVTQSAVKAKAFRKMSTVTPVSDALFTIPDEYNVAGNVITVYATNVLGDSDEVSITIPAKATPTPVPTATPTKRPSNPNPPVVVITNTPEVTATPTVEPTSTPVPEYKLTVEDVYYDEDGTKEKSDERLTITVKEGEHYSYPSLDKDNYIARVSKFEGTVTSDVKLVFEYDKKKSKDLIVQGYVKKSDGTPVDNSLVEIVDEESKSDVTDNTGFYRIEGVSEGEHDYTLYSGTTTGSSIVAKCKISVKDNNGEVKVTFKSEDSKIDTQTEEGVVHIDATLFDEEVTQSPTPTEVPTPEPTVEPTVIPTVEPTPVVTTTPAVTASPEINPKPTVVPPSDMPTPLEPDEVETPKPTKKPIKSTHKVVGIPIFTPEPDNEVKEERVTLVQTGLYDNTKSVVGLILTSLGVCILFISLKKRNKK